VRIAHLGTFDVGNYGDLLFPLVAEARLRALAETFGIGADELEIVHFSPLGGPPVWSDAVSTRPIAELDHCGPFDAVILGGGHLVHALPTNLPAYQDAGAISFTAYPSLWLSAARIAARDGAKLLWNAPGVARPLAGRAAALLQAATEHIHYLAVRDETSAGHLRNSGVTMPIHVVPDTALELPSVWTSAELRPEYEAILATGGKLCSARTIAIHVKERYLDEPIEALAERIDAYCAEQQATAIVLALGPCHGDDALARRLGAAMKSRPVVIDRPMRLRAVTACLAHCDAYIGSSLHGLIVATAYGRQAYCVASENIAGPPKFSGFLGQIGETQRLVSTWGEAIDLAARAADSAISLPEANTKLDRHWGRIGDVLFAKVARDDQPRHVLMSGDRDAQDLAILASQAETALHAVGRAEKLDVALAESRQRERTARAQASSLRRALEKAGKSERRARNALRDAQRAIARRERDLSSLSGWLDHLQFGVDALLTTRRWRLGNWIGDAFAHLRGRRDPLVTELFQDIFRRHARWRDRRRAARVAVTRAIESVNVTASIVVPVHNALDAVRSCLESLVAHTDPRHTIVLVDDASDAECQRFLAEFAARHAHATVLRDDVRQGYTRSANRGWQHAQGDYVVLLNSDTVVTAGWLEKLLRCGESDAKIGLVGPISNAASWQSAPERFDESGDWIVNTPPEGWTLDDVATAVDRAARPKYPRVPLLNGFCLAIKRRVAEEIGYFDEAAFPEGYGEENDYCLRAAAAGFELAVADDAYVFHAKSQSYGHARRRELTDAGQQALRFKHGTRSLRRAVEQLRDNPALAAIRERLVEALARPRSGQLHAEVTSTSSVLFLLPVRGGGGGAHSVVQEAAGMRRLGVRASVAIEARFAPEFERQYPAWFADDLFFVYRDRDELAKFSGDFDVVVATVYFSMRLLRRIVRKHPGCLPAYYVQDYEPRFFPRFSRLRHEARRSYGCLPGLVHFAKTAWIRDEVKRRHGVEVHVVTASLDHAVFFPPAIRQSDGRVRVAAMIRPSTPYRGAERTLRTLRALQSQNAHVELCLFGATDDERAQLADANRAGEHWHGRLTREGVADLLRACDVFVDLSDYQAFGRTGLEAMACGAAVVLPSDGGAREFAEDEVNALLVDTRDEAACHEAVARLVNDSELRYTLSEAALETAGKYSIEAAARSELDLFAREIARRNGRIVAPVDALSVPLRSHARVTARRVHAILPSTGFGWPGSSHIRVLSPLGHPAIVDKLALSVGDAQRAIPDDAETILVQRTALPSLSAARQLVETCRRRTLRLVVELDDDLWALPQEHPERQRYLGRLAALEFLLSQADLATVPTETLARRLAARTARVEVIPNALDERLWFRPMARRQRKDVDEGTVRFLLMGTRTHAADLEIVAPGARRLLAEFGDRVRFDVIGCVPRGARGDWFRAIRTPEGAQEYPRFVRWLRRRNCWQIGLAPLRDLPFNTAKSAIKFLDYSALGLATVASDAPAYQGVIRQLDTGLLTPNTLDSWHDAMRMLVLKDDFRRQLAAAALRDVRERYTLEQVAERWGEALSEAPRTLPAAGDGVLPGLAAAR
jgi:GT2 family glycosyltransferase/glycosyltransferase involved in cell wall biosynthesis/polysaccharide pyruvyl transferase WcaK-like protein